eukprot:CAMPEP_0172863718 /NCGR_PEP_ID=MMETSP1075-20121228/78197_1 /TAXON_ID=2916 /ORGANISM="Ceratium fusus, Strain PA161109" /LENGTH=78 /DNA_ID=CAMNT_0013712415 /DNA_START=17 /DNA_END=249 /DNA_ORIENTATION=+
MAFRRVVTLALVSGVFVALGLGRTVVVPSAAFATISNPSRGLVLGANRGVTDNRQINGRNSMFMGSMLASMMVTAGFV